MPSAPAETRRKQESAAVLESDRQPAGTSCRSVCGDSATRVGSQPQEGQERVGAPPGARGDAPIPISSVLGVAGWRRRSAACSALQKAAGERRFVGLWLQARLLRHSPAKTYTSKILRVSNACFTWRPLFLSVNKKLAVKTMAPLKHLQFLFPSH